MNVELVIALIAGAVLAAVFLYLYAEGDETEDFERQEPVETPRNDAFRNNRVDD